MDHFCRILPGAKSLKKRQLSGDDARGDISCHAEAYLEALWPVDYRTLTAINSPVLEDFYIKCGLSESHFDQFFFAFPFRILRSLSLVTRPCCICDIWCIDVTTELPSKATPAAILTPWIPCLPGTVRRTDCKLMDTTPIQLTPKAYLERYPALRGPRTWKLRGILV